MKERIVTRRTIFFFISVLLSILVCLPFFEVNAATISNGDTIDALTFYNSKCGGGVSRGVYYGDSDDKTNGYIYFATKTYVTGVGDGTKFSTSSIESLINPFTFNTQSYSSDGATMWNSCGIQIKYGSYYVETTKDKIGKKAGGIEYDNGNGLCKLRSVVVSDSYLYCLYRISYSDVLEMFFTKYPTKTNTSAFEDLVDDSTPITFTINNIICALNGSSAGNITYNGDGTVDEIENTNFIYRDQSSSGVDGSYFNINVTINPKPISIIANKITISGSTRYQKSTWTTNKYYIRAGANYNLVYTSKTKFATSRFQPNVNYYSVETGGADIGNIKTFTANGMSLSSNSKKDVDITGSLNPFEAIVKSDLVADRLGELDRLKTTVTVSPKDSADGETYVIYPHAYVSDNGAVDSAGNADTDIVARYTDDDNDYSLTLIVDGTAPTIGGVSSSAWTSGNVTLSPVSSDSGSGVKSTTIKNYLGTVVATDDDNTTSCVVSTPGTSNFTVYSTDNVGNTSSKVFTANIDRTPPTITNVNASYGWTNQDVTISPNAVDTQSGVANVKIYNASTNVLLASSTYLDLDSATYKCTQTMSLRIESTDKVGNTSSRIVNVYIDKIAPTITNLNTSYGWTNDDIDITPKATDTGGSGMKSLVINNSAGTKVAPTSGVVTSTLSYSIQAIESNEGEKAWNIVASDNAGNTTTKTVTSKIDITAPVITGTDDNGLNKETLIQQSATDEVGGSGMAFLTLRNAADEVQQQITTDPFTLSFETDFLTTGFRDEYWMVYAQDKAGNTASKKITTEQALKYSLKTVIPSGNYH